LVANVTGDPYEIGFTIPRNETPFRKFQSEESGEWLKFIFDIPNFYHNASVTFNISITLCFIALDNIETNIHAYTYANHTEPVAITRPLYPNTTFEAVRTQLGQHKNLNHDERGILTLEAQDWLLQNSSSSDLVTSNTPSHRNWLSTAITTGQRSDHNTMVLAFDNYWSYDQDNITIFKDPDVVLGAFMQDILKTDGGIAFMIQAICHVLASISYYDQMPYFDTADAINVTSFLATQLPGGMSRGFNKPAGFLPGYTAVMIILIVHSALFSLIAWTFILSK
jgi:hypothetical protein